MLVAELLLHGRRFRKANRTPKGNDFLKKRRHSLQKKLIRDLSVYSKIQYGVESQPRIELNNLMLHFNQGSQYTPKSSWNFAKNLV